MQVYQILTAKAKGLGFTIMPLETNKLTLIGSSVPMSESNRLLFGQMAEDCNEGLVILHANIELRHVYTHKREGGSEQILFLPIIRRGENAYVEKDEAWVPPAGVLPKVSLYGGGYALELQIGEECFTTAVDGAKEGKRVVGDANLLCRFLVGEVTLDGLQASATELIRQQSLDEKYQALLKEQRELEIQYKIKQEEANNISTQLTYVQSLLTLEEGEKQDLTQELKAATDSLGQTRQDLQMATDCLDRIRGLTKNLFVALRNWNIIRVILTQAEQPDQG